MRHFIFMFLLLSLLTGCQTPIPKDSKLGREIAKLENTYKTRKERLNRVKKELNNAQNTHKSTPITIAESEKETRNLACCTGSATGANSLIISKSHFHPTNLVDVQRKPSQIPMCSSQRSPSLQSKTLRSRALPSSRQSFLL